MKKDYENFILRFENSTATIVLNRINFLNVFNTALLKEFDEILDNLIDNKKIKVVILSTASEKVFTAGADIKEMVNLSEENAKKFSKLGHKIANKLENELPPVIAALRGYVLGGGIEFACACDIRVAAETTIFSHPEINLGIFPGWGGSQRLAKIVGYGKAKELIYTGTRFSPVEALHIGLVNYVVPDKELDNVVKKIAYIIAEKSRNVLMTVKHVINKGLETTLSNALEYEIQNWAKLFGKYDQKEGMNAFLEQRKPKFKCNF